MRVRKKPHKKGQSDRRERVVAKREQIITLGGRGGGVSVLGKKVSEKKGEKKKRFLS